MTGNGHRHLACASAVAFLPSLLFCTTPFHAATVTLLILAGATAPDWLEIRIGKSTIIPHRTFTHILLLWLALLLFGIFTWSGRYLPSLISAGFVGFAIGGITHCIGDIGTPMGIPIWHPFRRFSFRLWSEKTEIIPILIAWIAAGTILAITLLIEKHLN